MGVEGEGEGGGGLAHKQDLSPVPLTLTFIT